MTEPRLLYWLCAMCRVGGSFPVPAEEIEAKGWGDAIAKVPKLHEEQTAPVGCARPQLFVGEKPIKL